MAVPHQAGRGLRVHLDGEEIVVWQRGTVFLIAFKKAPRQPRLIVDAQLASQLRVQTSCRVQSESGLSSRSNKARALGWGVVVALASKRIRPSLVARDHPRRFTAR